MKSKSFYFIIALMIATLLGLVLTQLFWFNKTYQVAEKEFDENVNSAMNDVLREMKSRDLLFVLEDSHFGQKNKWSPGSDDTQVHIVNESRTISSTENDSLGDSSRVELTILKRSINGEEETTILVDSVINDSSITRITTLGEGEPNWENLFVDNDLEEIVSEIIVQYSLDTDPIQTRLKDLNLDSLIEAKLKVHDINGEFSYGITNEESDGFIQAYSKLSAIPQQGEVFKKDLFQDDVFKLTNQLLLYFQSKSPYIFKELRMMLIVLGLLTVLLILTFVYALRIIWKQKQLDAMKNDFINNMTHEFKTPVATINLALDSMRHKEILEDTEKILKYNAIIRDENNRINRQVERVLDIARFSNNNQEEKLTVIDLKSSIKEALKVMELQISKSKANVELEMDVETIKILGHEDHLQNLWINLIDNALKYSKEEIKIVIRCKEVRDSILVEVEDNGIGMSKSQIARVFENFYRGSNGDIHHTKGFGLGMSYVKKIMEMHKGEVQVKSLKDEGTTVVLNFKKS